MNIYEEYAIELLLSRHLKGAGIGNGYITAYMNECKITNPKKLDKWLLKNDYLRKPTIKESLTSYKVTELKEFLSKKDMKVTGKKDDLIERLLSVMTEREITSQLNSDNRYFLSEKGLMHYNNNIDLEELHRNWKYGISLEDYFKYRKIGGGIKGYYETAYLVMQDKIKHGTIGRLIPNNITSCDFSFLSTICEKLQMNEDALKYALISLCITTNLLDSFYLDKEHIAISGSDYLCKTLSQDTATVFIQNTILKIVNLSEYYSPHMVDEIYENIKLQYVMFDKESFKAAINDMIKSAYFDASPYMKIIIKNYKKYLAGISPNEKAGKSSWLSKFLKG